MDIATLRAAGPAALEIDQDVVRRLSVLPEEAVLAYFWLRVRHGDERLLLLLQLTQVVIARPSTWSSAAIRLEHERRGDRATLTLDARACFACGDNQNRRYFHHIVEVQNGGSNTARNLVPLCFADHQYLHPWLTEEPAPTHVTGFESLWQIASRCVGDGPA